MTPHLVQLAQAFGLQVLKYFVWLALLAAIFAPLERLFALHRTPGWLKTVPADIASLMREVSSTGKLVE